MRVLQVTGTMNRGGAEVMLMDILRHLPDDVHFDFLIQLGRDNRIVTGEFDQEILDRGCRIFHISPQWKGGGIPYLRKFKQLIFNEIGVPDVIHSHINRQGGMVALAAHRCGIKKIIVHSHECRTFQKFDISPRAIEWKIQQSLIKKFATDYFSCSKIAAQTLFASSVLKEKRYTVINNALDFNIYKKVTHQQVYKLQAQLKINSAELKLGYVANFLPRKNYPLLLEILQVLLKRRIDTRLIIAGKILDQHCFDDFMESVQKKGLESNVIYLGIRDDIPVCLSLFDVFLAPAWEEAFGMVVTEAQAAGLPCVISPAYQKAVDLKLGLAHFMDNYNPEEWANKILQVKDQKITDKEEIYGAIVQSGFDAVENTKRIIELYKK